MSADIHSIELAPTDKDVAATYHARLDEQLGALCQLENEAFSAGFAFSYSIGFDAFGKKSVQQISVLKRLT